MQIKKIIQKSYKSSVLVVSLILMGIIVASALSVAFVTVKERKGSIGVSRSSTAYQMADTGIENILQAILKTSPAPADTSYINGCDKTAGSLTLGYITMTNSAGSYKVELKDENDVMIPCNSAVPLANVKKIKSTGISGQNSRAVQVSVSPTCDTADGLIGHWQLDEPAGNTIAIDSHALRPPNAQNASVPSGRPTANRTTGKFSGAYDFSNSSYNETTHIEDTDADAPYANLDQGAITAWVKIEQLGSNCDWWGWGGTLASFSADEGAGSWMRWDLGDSYEMDFPGHNNTINCSDKKFYIYQRWKAKCTDLNYASHAFLAAGPIAYDPADTSWHKVGFSTDGTNPVIYWDDQKFDDLGTELHYAPPAACVATGDPTPGSEADWLTDLNHMRDTWYDHYFGIGGIDWDADSEPEVTFPGAIDDVRMYNRALNDCDFTADMAGG